MRALKHFNVIDAAALAVVFGVTLFGSASALAQGAARAVATSAADSGTRPYWGAAREGWFWYEDPALDEPEKLVPPPKAVAKSPFERDLSAFNRFKKQVQQSLDAAVQNPSAENVSYFLELQAESRRKASAFTDNARVVRARMPWLSADADGARPTSPSAVTAFDQSQRDQNGALIRQLAETHGLYFFYRSDCKFCHAFAPTLKQFEQKYGMTVFAISLDGGPIPHFPNAQRDNGIFQRILTDAGIPPEQVQVPFTALASPSSREVLPLGFGVLGAADLVERIELTVRMQRQQAGLAQAMPSSLPMAIQTTARR